MYVYVHTHTHTRTCAYGKWKSVSSEVAGWGGPTELSADWQECVLNAEWILGEPLGIWNFVGQENAVGRLNRRTHTHSQLPSLSSSYPRGAVVPPHMSSCSLSLSHFFLSSLINFIYLFIFPFIFISWSCSLNGTLLPCVQRGFLHANVGIWEVSCFFIFFQLNWIWVWGKTWQSGGKFNHRHLGDHLLSFWGTKVLEVEESWGETFPSSFWGPHC